MLGLTRSATVQTDAVRVPASLVRGEAPIAIIPGARQGGPGGIPSLGHHRPRQPPRVERDTWRSVVAHSLRLSRRSATVGERKPPGPVPLGRGAVWRSRERTRTA
jgi:hypothetical protein